MKKKDSFFVELVKFILIAIFIVLPIRLLIASPFIVSGSSMVPTFSDGEYLIVEEVSYYFHEPQRGEVVIFKFPDDPSKFFIKRLIGLPGETVILDDGVTSVIPVGATEPIVVDEPYIVSNDDDSLRITLDAEEYFVLGDNRGASSDSRTWGPLEEQFIVGKAFVRLLPLNRIDVLPGSLESL